VSNLLILTVAFLAGAVIYRFSTRIVGGLRRFDAKNIARRADEMRSRFDKYAHYRQTVQLAEEQVERVTKISVLDPRTGKPVPHYLFDRVEYGTLAEAESARYDAIVAKAREFYIDLDRIYLSRRGKHEPTVAAPALPDPFSPENLKPPRP
jgi:hypothetical protein